MQPHAWIPFELPVDRTFFDIGSYWVCFEKVDKEIGLFS